ncbi:hypothetical protein M3Y97_00671000 [Aphelenchoides bicaudatus]|nr:hypothetical protein M3Y97_00671000 [Aphelenchoides bicaudatus]
MENGISTASPESSTAESVNSADSTRNVTLNGFAHTSYRERILCNERKALLEERRQILSGTDPVLLDQVRLINDQMNEQKQMLISRMERQFNWVSERCKEELDRLNDEEKSESGVLTELLYNQLEKLKDGLEEKIARIDVFDKRTLSVLHLANKELNLEPAPSEDEENGCESPANALVERRNILPGRLTGDNDIRDDLVKLNQSITPTDFDFHEVARPMRAKHRVVLDRGRLVYDGKTFYRGQKLFVQTTTYTRFPAIIFALADEYVHIRSRTPGDTREVYATIDDLRSGRVRIGRKVFGAGDISDTFDPQSP